jgi:hypothetical protein
MGLHRVEQTATIAIDPAPRHGRIFRIEFDQYRVALQAIGDKACRACAAETIKDNAWLGAYFVE